MNRITGLLGVPAILAMTALNPVFADGIDRLEPPFWWQGFEHRELQVVVHGEGIADFEPMFLHDGIEVSDVRRGDSPNYLFVYLTIDESAPTGSFDLVFSNDGTTLSHPFELRERSNDPDHVKRYTAEDVIYLLTPDRFANGDPDNDSVDGYSDLPNRSEPYGRHGGDLAGISNALDYIAGMGFTQIWLNPVLENAMDQAGLGSEQV